MEDYGNEEVYDGAENSVEEESADESGYPDDPQDNTEESTESTTGDGAEDAAGGYPRRRHRGRGDGLPAVRGRG